VFFPIEEGLKNGSFIDGNLKNKIVNKPITRYNPLKDMRATMGVNVWENDNVIDKGLPYRLGSSMTKAEFLKLKALGQTGLPIKGVAPMSTTNIKGDLLSQEITMKSDAGTQDYSQIPGRNGVPSQGSRRGASGLNSALRHQINALEAQRKNLTAVERGVSSLKNQYRTSL
jgi:hypothetical protein